MTILKFFIPLIALLIALLSLFTDTKEIKKTSDLIRKPKVLFLLILIIISSVATILHTHFEAVNHKNQIAEKDNRIEVLLKDAKDIKITTKDTNSELKNITNILEGFGIKNPENLKISQTEEIFKANKLRGEAIAKSKNQSNRNGISITYFPKNVDGQKVYSALEELNFTVTEGSPKNTGATNALYYGNNVDMESIKLVILTLLRAGVKIEGIFKFRNMKGKENKIQILHSGLISDSTRIEVEELLGIKL